MSRFSLMMSVAILMTISLVFHIIPNITTPVIDHLMLSQLDGIQFGVFGWCNTKGHSMGCSGLSIGYRYPQSSLLALKFRLPSGIRYSVTRLLVVHPIALVFVFVLWLMSLCLFIEKLGTSTSYTLGVALLSLPTFLMSLLAFLVDLLLFVPTVCWPAWMVLIVTIFIAICCSILWSLRRSAIMINYEALYSTGDQDNQVEMVSLPDAQKQKLIDMNETHDSDWNSSLMLEPELTYRVP
ncbi:hypothetical protein Kpol_1073p13 [Vanderwaltozyma polyspora DSM 70294]|uniref:PH-response regulator protein palI/RIM9 n=1 Tax=Vanderwaltozyma polyspora (strain ATCC 22028 / DSM 70294 / BCRC 21397 / CBS 2163 / NBRC 10782 / NRRL Y-8283 / UCD 57-17) TaxID=436907 RepID=A7TPS6_VANPO|nr:uncharacterized protein Kpol_1073p13 [Vanderwaltozyma polyspora DSM 70294]EDO15727.1 hypothetical protein Kpol_1073p13 [Vanderwaltozyma polyspora DSM 70294]